MKNFFLYLVLTFLLIGSLFMIAYEREMIVQNAPSYRIKPIPVDPRDFFRGDYVRLQYNFSDTPLYAQSVIEYVNDDLEYDYMKNHAYVAFDVTDSNLLIPKKVSIEKPEPPFMRITIDRNRHYLFGIQDYRTNITVKTPIDKFFLEQGKGKMIEKPAISRSVEVELSLSNDGIPVLTNLYYTDSVGEKQKAK